jgi:hypothetical protein
MSNDKRYFNIPVQMLKQLHTDKMGFLNNSFDVGVYNIAKGLEGDRKKRVKDAMDPKHLNVTTPDHEKCFLNGSHLANNYPSNSPIVGIEKEMYFDFYKNDKSDFDCSCLAAFLAIRSILGKKTDCKTNKQMIHARMFGYASIKDVPDRLTPEEAKYGKRWHMDKILLELQINWHLKIYSGHKKDRLRGMYVSFDLELPKLIEIAHKSKYMNKVAEFKKRKQAIIDKTELDFVTDKVTGKPVKKIPVTLLSVKRH